MPGCQFGERQYELAANLELLAGSGAFFTPTTSMENHLGIDAALVPGDPRVWQLLGVRVPSGVGAGPGTFGAWPKSTPSAASPPFLVSLFVQYKRTSHLTRSNAREWTTHGEPYWRVDLSAHQHVLLQQLEAATATDAVVRYAAPEFWQHEDMWKYQGVGKVLDRSVFAAPRAIGRHHSRLTWSPTKGLVGHSETEEVPAETSRDVALELRRVADRGREGPNRSARQHLAALAAAVGDLRSEGDLATGRRSRTEWQEVLEARSDESDLPPGALEPLSEIAMIAEAAHHARSSWLVVALSESPADEAG